MTSAGCLSLEQLPRISWVTFTASLLEPCVGFLTQFLFSQIFVCQMHVRNHMSGFSIWQLWAPQGRDCLQHNCFSISLACMLEPWSVESYCQRAVHLAERLSPHLHPNTNQTLRTYDVGEGGFGNSLQMLISLTLHLSSCHLQRPTSLQSIIYHSYPRSSDDHSLVLPIHTRKSEDQLPGKYFLLWRPKR